MHALINNFIGYTDNVYTVDQYEQEDLLAQVCIIMYRNLWHNYYAQEEIIRKKKF